MFTIIVLGEKLYLSYVVAAIDVTQMLH